MSQTRRKFLAQSTAMLAAASVNAQAADDLPIVDTHQHLWDLDAFRLPWHADAPQVLRRSYGPADYREATRGLNVRQTVYMEVDVDPSQKHAEAQHVVNLERMEGVTP